MLFKKIQFDGESMLSQHIQDINTKEFYIYYDILINQV